MPTRRQLVFGSGLCVLANALPAIAHEATAQKPFKLDREFEPQIVPFPDYAPGTIVIHPGNYFLYFTLLGGDAVRYGVGVGRAGLVFRGEAVVGRKAKWPSWRPTDNMIRREPGKYARYANGVPGGLNNPLGARALYLYRGNRDTMYRIHGTNEPSSIGKSVSNGCIRMLNDHVIDLYERVPVGTKVVVQ
ncbi:L,D-transpeptidase [Chelativorans intermedius]|uniref:L,D-transpeptidase n=1 Tax=Chelativorans intermedius TaxID=515947 RepID=A0ABV6DBZ8_9HYPH|nr:L,D-transpeptidase [Chelativorans intermedius]MCT9000331.1 L,D-transpeptidase [Chelativorans intermedius]